MSQVSKVEGDSRTTRMDADAFPYLSAGEGYERWAATYDHAPNPLLAREERYLSPLLTDLHKKSVLDLACGTGRWLGKIVTKGCRLAVGVDSSLAMLRIAARKSFITERLALASCESLPFHDATFDLAVCSFAVGHFPDLQSAAHELARVLRPSGKVFISDLHPEAYVRGWRVGFRDGISSAQIEMRPRSVDATEEEFRSEGFDLLTQESLWLGDPEKPIFEAAGKLPSFPDACCLPAIHVWQFKRSPSLLDFRSWPQQTTEAHE